MAETYLVLNLSFVLVALLVLRVRFLGRPQTLTVLALLVLTVVFDSIIVGLNIVGYDADKILGIYIGNAPIEDLFYALLAGLIIPHVWEKMGKKHDTNA